MRTFISRYPKFMANSPEFCDLQQALEPELLELWAARDSALAQLCVETADWGLQYWERTLGIPVEGAKALELRRSRVRVKLLGVDVTTVALVRASAEIYTGQEAEIREFPQEFRFAIDFGEYNGIPPHIRELTESLREILPAHLALDYLFVYTAEEAVKAAFTAFSETMPCLEVWPRSLRNVEITKAVSPVAATEHHSRVEIYPAEQEET